MGGLGGVGGRDVGDWRGEMGRKGGERKGGRRKRDGMERGGGGRWGRGGGSAPAEGLLRRGGPQYGGLQEVLQVLLLSL